MTTGPRYSLDPSSSVPLYEQLTSQLRKAITQGDYSAGQRIPSVRQLSKELDVSVATVRRACQQLLEEGWLVLRQGSGTFVSEMAAVQSEWYQGKQASPNMAHESLRTDVLEFRLEENLDHDLPVSDWSARIKDVFDGTNLYARYKESVTIDFRVGTPAFDLLEGNKWVETLHDWAQELVKLPRGHNSPAGFPELREEIARWLRLSRKVQCTPEDVFIVSGAQQARNLVARLLIGPGTKVALEDPGSIFARIMFLTYGASLIPLSVDESGLVIEELAKANEASLLYMTPSCQFPTGAVLSTARREKIARWAIEHNVIIIEDDNNSEFTYESRSSPAVQSFAGRDNTIYIGTFSQTIMPPWRIGYMVVPKALRVPLFRMKWLTDRCTSPIVQELVLKLFEGGFLKEHLKKAHKACDGRRQCLIDELGKLPRELAYYSPVKGGLHQMLWLPTRMNDIAVFDMCFEKSVGVLPVSPCFLTKPARPGIMLNFSALTHQSISEGMATVRNVLETLHGS